MFYYVFYVGKTTVGTTTTASKTHAGIFLARPDLFFGCLASCVHCRVGFGVNFTYYSRIYALDIRLNIFICLSVGLLCCLFIFQMPSYVNKNAVTAFVLSPSLSSSS